MFKHVFINRLKILLRNRTTIFWTLLFPIALGTFFHFAFANLTSSDNFEVVNIAIVDNNNYQANTDFKNVIESLSKKNNDQIFSTKYVSEKEAESLLYNGDITGYIEVKDKIEVSVSGNGIGQSIIKSVVDDYYQLTSTATNLIKFNPGVIKNGILNDINKHTNYFKDVSNSNIDIAVIYFYTLIGMICMYGGYWGIQTVNETEGNLTKQGARICVSPVHKVKILLSSLLVAFIIQYIEILLVFAYLVFVLGANFGNQIGYILMLTFVGCFAGISLGTFIGLASKKSENAKIGMVTIVSMTCSFLAGMMGASMKYIIEKNAPILAHINPVNLVTDALYALYYYPTHTRFFTDIIYLIIFSLVAASLAYLFMRRKKYDSI